MNWFALAGRLDSHIIRRPISLGPLDMTIPLESHPVAPTRLNAVGIHIPQPQDIDRHLSAYPGLEVQLNQILKEATERFPAQTTELSLELYRDPELNEKYLTLYVRAPEYSDQTMGEIETFSDQINSRFPRLNARFLITTDFQPARTKNGL